ncbi:MAG: hypothetical protein ERJ67_05135 [Aphanocapsa feldmannii 277cV]|uniref:GLTT repeat-containing protein n=2 Tax=Aphanocapsa feldmannii TaxID=192050 RepID=A0A524RNH3_9CHRO|nr:MAG: hypothetical protein ERJ67_05135 [Aphanocapsa feldmannii 277cV]TGH27296.1 MAG: hypothetical protein ERJ68_01400 [Aphanocapsa feldmannii 277cI]
MRSSTQDPAVTPEAHCGGRPRRIAFGIAPLGFVSIGVVPMGVVAIGVVPMGVLSIGAVAMGVVTGSVVGMGVLSAGVSTMGVWFLGSSSGSMGVVRLGSQAHQPHHGSQATTRPHAAEPMAMPTIYSTRAEAEAMADQLGCSGTKASSDGWIPCDTHHHHH